MIPPPKNSFELLLYMVGVIVLMLVGLELALRQVPFIYKRYARLRNWVWNGIKSQFRSIFRWLWNNHKEAVLGFAVGTAFGILVTLYFLGRLG